MIKRIREEMINLKYRLIVKGMLAKAEIAEAKEKADDFHKDNRGIAVIEIILILVIVMALAIVFRKNIKTLFDDIFNQINKSGSKLIKDY